MRIIFAILLLTSSIAFAGTREHEPSLDQDSILRDGNGTILTMKKPDAMNACANLGAHLPTLRELVKLYQSSGLVLKEQNEGYSEGDKIGYVMNPNSQNPDYFYISRKNYVRPLGDIGNYLFWSSSDSVTVPEDSMYLDSRNGIVDWAYRPVYKRAVRCVANQ